MNHSFPLSFLFTFKYRPAPLPKQTSLMRVPRRIGGCTRTTPRKGMGAWHSADPVEMWARTPWHSAPTPMSSTQMRWAVGALFFRALSHTDSLFRLSLFFFSPCVLLPHSYPNLQCSSPILPSHSLEHPGGETSHSRTRT